MKFAIFGLISASVDIRPLLCAWVAPRCHPRGPEPLKSQISHQNYITQGLKYPVRKVY